jgi:hypothetical protein
LYYDSKSDFIDESACIGLIKNTRTTYQGTGVNGPNQYNTFNSQGYPLTFIDGSGGTQFAKTWDSLGRPLTTSSFTDDNGCEAYLQYSYDDTNLILYADYVRSPSSCVTPQYGPNARYFNQDYIEIQRVDNYMGWSSTVKRTINSTAEICK